MQWLASMLVHVAQEAIRRTGLAGLDCPDLKFSVAATVEHFKLPLICCVWLYVAASYEKSPGI